jgi:hypothetical protein
VPVWTGRVWASGGRPRPSGAPPLRHRAPPAPVAGTAGTSGGLRAGERRLWRPNDVRRWQANHHARLVEDAVRRADVRERARVAVGAVDLGADRADAHVPLRAEVPGRDPARVVPGVVAHVVVDGYVRVERDERRDAGYALKVTPSRARQFDLSHLSSAQSSQRFAGAPDVSMAGRMPS